MMTKEERQDRRAAIQAAASNSKSGDLRKLIRDAEILLLWLKDDSTNLAFELIERYDNE